MTRRAYCTYTDHRYLSRALTLIESMRRQGCNDEIWVCCLSEECRKGLAASALNNVVLLDLVDLEKEYPRLLEVKRDRTALEYYFTCTPLLVEYAFRNSAATETVTYLDSDLFFFDSPDRVHNEIDDAPVAIIPHNHVAREKWRDKYGLFNVGWVSFRRSEEGLQCLAWWKERCLEWCNTHVEGERYADQGYLNAFPRIAPHTKILTHKGCNAAPWNLENYRVHLEDDKVFLDEDPLLFFHFHGVRRAFRVFYFNSHRKYKVPYSRVTRNHIYRPYIARLVVVEAGLRDSLPMIGGDAIPPRGRDFLSVDVRNAARSSLITLYQLFDLLLGRAILVRSTKVY